MIIVSALSLRDQDRDREKEKERAREKELDNLQSKKNPFPFLIANN